MSQRLYSPGNKHSFSEVRSSDFSNHGSGPALGAIRKGQTLAWPNLHLHVPTKSTVAQTRPIFGVEALIVNSDVQYALTLQNHSQGCQFTVCAATKRGFHFFLNCMSLWDSAVVSVPLLYMGIHGSLPLSQLWNTCDRFC